MIENIRLNTIIFPSKMIREKVRFLSKQANLFGETSFVLDDQNYYPHITLYSPEYPSGKEDEICGAISAVARVHKPFEMAFDRFISAPNGGVLANYLSPAAADELRKQIIQVLNPLRGLLIREKYKNYETNESYTPEQKKEISDYGYPLNQYHFPHITVAHFTDKDRAMKFAESNIEPLPSFMVDRLAVCEMGALGTCTRILKEFPLG